MLKEWIVQVCEVTIMMKMKAFQKRTIPFGNKWHMASNKKAVTYIHCEIGQYFASFHQPGGSISIHVAFNLLLWNDHFHNSNLPSVTIISRFRENRPTLKTLEIILDYSGSFLAAKHQRVLEASPQLVYFQQLLDWPKSLGYLHNMLTEKPEWTLWPTQCFYHLPVLGNSNFPTALPGWPLPLSSSFLLYSPHWIKILSISFTKTAQLRKQPNPLICSVSC